MTRLKLSLLSILVFGCDLESHKKCDWVLEPEPDLIGRVPASLVPMCARNRTIMKQDCRLAAPLDFAKKLVDRKFRYKDLVFKSPQLPREILQVTYCDGHVERLETSQEDP